MRALFYWNLVFFHDDDDEDDDDDITAYSTLSILPILAVCRMRVTYELSKMALLTMSSRSSVNRAPARCLGGQGFDSRRGLRIVSVSHARDMLNIYC